MYDNLYPPSNQQINIVPSPPMYNSRTPSPQGYQFPHNITPNNTYYAQNSLSSNVHSPIISKQILFYLSSHPDNSNNNKKSEKSHDLGWEKWCYF